VDQWPILYNTLRRLTNANLKLSPLSKVSYQVRYEQDAFQGPSLSPSGYQVAGSYRLVLQVMQRNSADDFFREIDWKPLPETQLAFAEQVHHYKEDSFFNLDPSYVQFQEADGTPLHRCPVMTA
jgi:hypothetical protein